MAIGDRKQLDIATWAIYNKTGANKDRQAVLKRMDPLIQSHVNKWQGPIPRAVLENKAKVLAVKAFKTFDPDRGNALSTHVMNGMLPLSRVVYAHQNTGRLPENITLKMNSYNTAKDYLATIHGREPTVDELHSELGWTVNELNRIQNYLRKDLVESVGGLNDAFFSNVEDEDADAAAAVFFDLLPDEKKLFEYSTGYNGVKILSSPDIMKKMNISQAQLSYKKKLLTGKISRLQARRKRRR